MYVCTLGLRLRIRCLCTANNRENKLKTLQIITDKTGLKMFVSPGPSVSIVRFTDHCLQGVEGLFVDTL